MGAGSRIVAGTAAVLTLGTLATAAGVWTAVHQQVATVTLPAAVAPEPGSAAADAATTAAGAVAAPAQMGGTNMVVLGSDSRISGGDATVHSDARADTTMLVHLGGDNRWAYVLSLPRDLMVDLPVTSPACSAGMPARGRLNVAFTYGGAACTTAAVSKLTGLHIDHAAAVDFTGFARLVDAAGGFDVCLTEPVDDPDAQVTLPAGTSHVDGDTALGLVRMRETVGDGSDIGRTARQRWLMGDFVRQLSGSGALTNPMTALALTRAVIDNVDVDSGLTSPATVAGLLSTASTLSGGGVSGATYPWLPNPADPHNTVVEDRGRARTLLADLAADRNPADQPEMPAPASSAPPGALPAPAETPNMDTPTPAVTAQPAPAQTAADGVPEPFCAPAGS